MSMANVAVAQTVDPPSYEQAIGHESRLPPEPRERSERSVVRTQSTESQEADGLHALRALASNVTKQMFGSPLHETETAEIAEVVPRELAPIRVSKASNGGYIAGVDLPFANMSGSNAQNKQRATAKIGPFRSEEIAWIMARAFAPAVWRDAVEGSCGNCRHTFALFRRCHHCRNCGLAVCSRCSVHWPQGALPEAATATDIKSFTRAAKIFADRLPLAPNVPESTKLQGLTATEAMRAWTSRTTVRVCLACEKAAADVRRSMLAGISVAEAEQKLETGAWANLNFQRPLATDFHLGGLLPIHAAVASGSLPLVQWLIRTQDCAVDGPTALTAGTPPKSVLRVAVEHAATEILEWLLFTDAVRLPYHDLPLSIPPSLDVATPVALRALAASLRDAHKLRHLLDQVLTDAAPLQHEAFEARPSAAFAVSSSGLLPLPTAPPPPDLAIGHDSYPDDYKKHWTAEERHIKEEEEEKNDAAKECAVCFSILVPEVRCALVPCGHTSCCQECAGSLSSCPMCRSPVERAMRIFVEA